MVEFDEYGNKKQDEKYRRESNNADIRYRKIVQVTFEKELKKALPEDCTLCFHGTPIWNAKEILQSGNISALIDRVGARENVLPMPGQISVSTINNLWFTIKYHADLFDYNYPAGCIFVITPKDEQEIKSSREENTINNIYFAKEPERLKAIITTPENIEIVKTWVADSKLNINCNIVMDYEHFIKYIQQEYDVNKSLTV